MGQQGESELQLWNWPGPATPWAGEPSDILKGQVSHRSKSFARVVCLLPILKLSITLGLEEVVTLYIRKSFNL